MRVLGLDQSLKRTGIAVVEDGKVIDVRSTHFDNVKIPAERRERLQQIVKKYCEYYKIDMIVVERIRGFSNGFVSFDTIIELGALVKFIIQAVYKCEIKVYSVDTRAWKSKILGTAKATKQDAIVKMSEVLISQRFDKTVSNDDEAEAIAIALYAFYKDAKLKEET